MTFSLRFRPEIVDDLEAAAKWYDERSVGLGGEFLQECRATLDRIRENPKQVAIDADGVRSTRLHRFPFVVHYRTERNTVVVIAIMFGGRDPSAWRDRV